MGNMRGIETKIPGKMCMVGKGYKKKKNKKKKMGTLEGPHRSVSKKPP